MKQQLLALIDQEIAHAKQGEPAKVMVKTNSLSNKEMIDKLVEASQAGVEVILLVRGICCLQAGIPGVSDHITIKSIARPLSGTLPYLFLRRRQAAAHVYRFRRLDDPQHGLPRRSRRRNFRYRREKNAERYAGLVFVGQSQITHHGSITATTSSPNGTKTKPL